MLLCMQWHNITKIKFLHIPLTCVWKIIRYIFFRLSFDGISEDTFSGSFSVGVECGYVLYLILIFFKLLESGQLNEPYRELYIRTNHWTTVLFVTAITHSTASWVFICPCKFIISCFYPPINFLFNFGILQGIRASRTSTQLLVHVISSWHVWVFYKFHTTTFLLFCILLLPEYW